MKHNTIQIDSSVYPNKLIFSKTFNVAVPFIDRHITEGRADKAAILFEKKIWTYLDLYIAVNKYGNHLQSLGVKPGKRLLMVVEDCPEFIALFFGAIKAGLIPIAVNTMLKMEDYKFLITDSECSAVFYSEVLKEKVEAAFSGLGDKLLLTRTIQQFALDAQSEGHVLDVATSSQMSECFWLYSSGSTGNPKGVVHPHRSMVCTSERFARSVVGLQEDDTVFSASKLFHSYGFGNAMTFPLWVGATTILSNERVSPSMSFEVIEKFKPTVFFGVPTLYAQQLRAIETLHPDLSSIRLCISAGEALPNDVFRRWKKKTNTVIVDGLGSTENLHIFISNRPDNVSPGTSGLPVPGYEVKLLDEDEQEINEAGEIGTVWVKGESAASLYWNNPNKTASTMRGQWLNTGDMYYRDAEGYYHNAGRRDDMMKVGGLWCSPFEIENCLAEHPEVLEAAVVAKRDPDGLVKPAAFIVLNKKNSDKTSLELEFTAHCKEALSHYKYPRWYYFLENLPKTETGKIQRFRLRNDVAH